MSVVSSNEVTIVVSAPPPPPPPPAPTCTLSVDKTSGNVGDTFTFTVYITGLTGNYYVYLVDRAGNILAGGLQYLTSAGTTVIIKWTPTAAGTYYIHAEVWYTV